LIFIRIIVVPDRISEIGVDQSAKRPKSLKFIICSGVK